MPDIFVSADIHFNHKKIIEYCNRPWTFEEQNEEIISRWNNLVKPNDLVYFLGDMMLIRKKDHGTAKMQECRDLIKRLNGEIILIKGNHDNFDQETFACFKEVYQFKEIEIDGEIIALRHKPMPYWNRMLEGRAHLFGHLHEKLQYLPLGVAINVGIDAPLWNYGPAPWETLKQKIKERRKIYLESRTRE